MNKLIIPAMPESRELNRWGRGKLSPIERTTAFVIAIMKMHKGLSGIGIEANLGEGVRTEKKTDRVGVEIKADRYHAVVMLNGISVRVELDKKMYEDYLSEKPFNNRLNYEDYE